MTQQKVSLSREELKKINQTLGEFKEIEKFDIIEGHHGIGSSIDLVFEGQVNGILAKVTIPITGSENW